MPFLLNNIRENKKICSIIVSYDFTFSSEKQVKVLFFLSQTITCSLLVTVKLT